MTELKFQLVIQFVVNTSQEFEAFSRLTEGVTNALADEPQAFVDGHDFGLGEFNIFIHTNDPKKIFAKTAGFIDSQRPGIAFAAGYRDFDEDTYTVLWPSDAEEFVVS